MKEKKWDQLLNNTQKRKKRQNSKKQTDLNLKSIQNKLKYLQNYIILY